MANEIQLKKLNRLIELKGDCDRVLDELQAPNLCNSQNCLLYKYCMSKEFENIDDKDKKIGNKMILKKAKKIRAKLYSGWFSKKLYEF